MKRPILRISALALVLFAQSCKRNERHAWSGAEFDLTPCKIETAERQGATNAAAAFKLFLYYSYSHYDPKKSTMWVRQAAELGEPIAQFNLASIIGQRGWSQAEYRKWMALAAAQGDPHAIKALNRLDQAEGQ